MALESLRDITKLGGSAVCVMDDLRRLHPERFNESGGMDWRWFESEIRQKFHIHLRRDKNSISFTLQNGPVKEVGQNGCQVDALIDAARWILVGFQKQVPCRETAIAITKLEEAMLWLMARRLERESRKVEGTSQS
jgi:hypothetical protein